MTTTKGAWDLASKSEEGEPREWTRKQGEPITERSVHGVPPTARGIQIGSPGGHFPRGNTDFRFRARGATLHTFQSVLGRSVFVSRQ
jgi:hypothetical protein